MACYVVKEVVLRHLCLPEILVWPITAPYQFPPFKPWRSERSTPQSACEELARHYGFTDYDGRRPDWGALAIDWSLMPPAFVDLFRTATRKQSDWLNTLARRTEQFTAKLPPVS
jgi:hypothetical protein